MTQKTAFAMTLALGAGAASAQSFSYGTYEGSWFNNTFMSTGSASVIVEDLGMGDIQFTMDLGGFVFGLGDPDPVVTGGTLAGGAVTFDSVMGDPLYGDVSGGVDAAGNVTIDMIAPAMGSFGSVEIRGTWIDETIDLTYTIREVTGAPFADGTIQARLIPAPGAVALLGLGGLAATRRRR